MLQVLNGLTVQVWKLTGSCEHGIPMCSTCQAQQLAEFAEWAWVHGWAIQRVDRSGGESEPPGKSFARAPSQPPRAEGTE